MGRDLENTIGIEVEGDLNLRNATRGRGDAGELELAEDVVVLGHGALTLEDLNEDDGLVVGGGGEDLALAGGDRSVTGDELGHDTTSSLDTEGQRVDVHEDNLLSTLLAGKDTSLDGGAKSDSLVGVDTLGGLLATEVLLNEGLNLRDTGGATDEDNVVNVLLLDLGILDDLFDGLKSLLEEIHVELLELGASHGLGEINTIEEGLDLDTGRHLGRERALELLSLTLELTHGLGVLGDVNVVLLVEGLGEVVDDALIEILTTQVGVTGGGKDLEDTLINGQERNIKSTTTEIVDNDVALASISLIKTVGNGGGGGLVDNAEDVEAGNDTGILGSLALVVVEVGGDGDDGVSDLLSKVALSDILHLAQNHGRDLLRGEVLVGSANLDANNGLALLVHDLEGEVLDIGLDLLLLELATDQTPN